MSQNNGKIEELYVQVKLPVYVLDTLKKDYEKQKDMEDGIPYIGRYFGQVFSDLLLKEADTTVNTGVKEESDAVYKSQIEELKQRLSKAEQNRKLWKRFAIVGGIILLIAGVLGAVFYFKNKGKNEEVIE